MSDNRALITIRSSRLSAVINPLGAELNALRDAQDRDLLWQGDPRVWAGRAPILFPIVGMLNQGRYRLGDQTYNLQKHGFARHSLFDLVEASEASATFLLRWSQATLAVYPFRFELEVRFSIESAILKLSAVVSNLGADDLPASIGFHPAVRWPLPYGQPRANHLITFDQNEPAPVRRIDSHGLVIPEAFPTPVVGRCLELSDELFVRDALIFDQVQSRRLRYGATAGPVIEIGLPDIEQLGVWTKPGAGFICIEPWHGLADPEGFVGDLWAKPGIFRVAPCKARRFEMTIALA